MDGFERLGSDGGLSLVAQSLVVPEHFRLIFLVFELWERLFGWPTLDGPPN